MIAALIVAATLVAARNPQVVVTEGMQLLPKRPARVHVVHTIKKGSPFEGRDGFTLPQSRPGIVFVTLQPRSTLWLLVREIKNDEPDAYRFYLHVLAATMWHEMAHLDGADEATAQRAEEELWQTFIRDGKVHRALGVKQAQLYASRRGKNFDVRLCDAKRLEEGTMPKKNAKTTKAPKAKASRLAYVLAVTDPEGVNADSATSKVIGALRQLPKQTGAVADIAKGARMTPRACRAILRTLRSANPAVMKKAHLEGRES